MFEKRLKSVSSSQQEEYVKIENRIYKKITRIDYVPVSKEQLEKQKQNIEKQIKEIEKV